MKTIQVNGTTLAYKEFGSGDKYLLSTQNFFLTGCHEELLGKPPYDYHVFLVIMRGYGESEHVFDPEPRDYTKIWGEDLLAFADAMGIKSFFYTGVSHGNWAGWYIGFHYPERIRAFACCDGIAQYRKLPDFRPRNLDEIVGNREALDKIAWIENWPTENPQRLEQRRRNHEEHLQIILGRKREEFTVMNNNMASCDAQSEEELFERMGKISFPVMLWNGMLDPLAKVENVVQVAKAIPGAVLHVYQELGHGGADECPELTARDCDRFFRDTADRIL